MITMINVNRRKLEHACRKAFWYKNVDCVLGFAFDNNRKLIPTAIFNSSEINRLVWNNACKLNLVRYLLNNPRLLEKAEKIAVILKACEANTVKKYFELGKIKRKQLFILGIECNGMINEDGKKYKSCIKCQERAPSLYDTLIRCKNQSQESICDNNLEAKNGL